MADDTSGKHLEVALVAAERTVWQGQAKIVIARTTDGEVGILPGHAPLLGLLQAGTVQVRTVDDEYFVAAAPDGFISVANDRVSSWPRTPRWGTTSTWSRPAAIWSARRRPGATPRPHRRTCDSPKHG